VLRRATATIVVTFDDWLAGAHKSAALKRALTESGADSLATTVQSWCAGAKDVQSRSVVAALARARFAADDEKRELDELRIPRIAYHGGRAGSACV
jgi:hypothetical protein